MVLLVVYINAMYKTSVLDFLSRYKYLLKKASPVVSGHDGESYKVHLEHPQSGAAADHLAHIHGWVIDLLEHLRTKYLRRPGSPRRRVIVQNLLDRYDPNKLHESSPNNPHGDTAFTIGKGEVLAICLRERNPAASGEPDVHDFHSMQLIWFVTIHELAHLGIDKVGHPLEFWEAFKFLLSENELAMVGPPGAMPDYENQPVSYCGINVNYNPLYDTTLNSA